jgi:KaiC/GvpD/RAD55 family RecA-like ATPase
MMPQTDELQKTGIDFFDEAVGGFLRGSRTIIIGPPGSGKTVFGMQYLWAGLQAGETVSWDVYDRPWPYMRSYFASFGWRIGPFEESGKLIPIQAMPHYDPYPRDPRVRYFDLPDFEAMRALDLELSRAGTTRFVFGDGYEHIFRGLPEERWHEIEEWTVNWTFHDRISNFDIVSETPRPDDLSTRMMDVTYLRAHNVIRFRTVERGGRFSRELRIERMERVSHPLEWMPFVITDRGIRRP